MLELSKSGNGKAGNAQQLPQQFFTQFVALPPAVHGAPIQIVAVTGSGIPMRDYFASRALSLLSGWDDSVDNFEAMCHDAYRMADAMLKAREPEKSDNNSQFHEDHMKPMGK